MERFVRAGVKFSTFVKDGIRYLCTGEVDGTIKFDFAGEICDYAYVTGATSVVSGAADASCDELYLKWLEATAFYREIGVEY